MNSGVCESCLANYCSCVALVVGDDVGYECLAERRGKCLVHSCCSFCNRPLLSTLLLQERSVKRKFARVYDEEDEEVALEGEASPKRHRDEEVEALRRALQEERAMVNRLYLELEEERNAAAVAAGETLSMISRLQEEKAAVQMEARQYKRMVEERRVYDQEAIDMLNDILVKQEEEKLALEKEIEKYRETESGRRCICSRERVGLAANSVTPGDEDYLTPFEATPVVHSTRNLLDSFQSADQGSRSWRREDVADVHPRSDHRSSRGSPLRAAATQMDIDDPRDDSGASGVHDVYEVPHRYSDERSDGYRPSPDAYQSSRSPQRGYDRLGKPEPSSSYSRTSRDEASRQSALVRQDEALVSELRKLNQRLRMLEAERDLKYSSPSPYGLRHSMNGEMEILEEISQQLRHFQALERKQDDVKDLPEGSFVFSFKGIFSFRGLRQSLHSQINRLACMFLKHADGGLGYGEHHVGLSHLLENSCKPRGSMPCITRGIKVDALPTTFSGSSGMNRQSTAWPMDARGRSETAFGGWDY